MTTPAGDLEKTARFDSGAREPAATPLPDGPQFAPGSMVADRYRIAGIVGAGGMGEVYRADDLKLGQTVALKFIPSRLERDPLLLGRLHDEVRLGRQVAHPNVCRIYDIVEWDRRHFVAMEFVDGEDLSRLLRRIGRISHDKAVDIARGIAAGLAAAHAKGILHRDLKPANIMIDSRGEARIMDFGLALDAGEDDGTISGTPAYMAPEMVEGQPATVQSDLYAMGLVIYELFTGRRVHSSKSLNERRRDLSSQITVPSDVVRDLDVTVERVILRCLSPDPMQRPRSARDVIEALPGGDPLAAALAAGETPSPRIVAAAGAEGSLSRSVAWSLLGVAAICLAAVLAMKWRYGVWYYVSFDRPPEVLSERGRETLRALGIPEERFVSGEVVPQEELFSWLFQSGDSPERWDRLRAGPAVVTWRRTEMRNPPAIRLTAAPVRQPVTAIDVDPSGRLVGLQATPSDAWPRQPLDWRPLLHAAGLSAARLQPAVPRHVPGSAADARAAWTARHPDDGTPITIEAAAWQGVPVSFRIDGAWNEASPDDIPFSSGRVAGFGITLFASVILLGSLLAWRNMRLRRGDRQSAFRVAAFVFVLEAAWGILSAEHYLSAPYETSLVFRLLGDAMFWGVVSYVLYIALEPVVRRRWPHHLIASTRLLSGNVRDPMVGRDVLVGVIAGLLHPAIIGATHWVQHRSGSAVSPLYFGDPNVLRGSRFGLAHVATSFSSGAIQGFIFIVLLVIFVLIFRKPWLAAAGLAAVATAGYYFAIGAVTVPTLLVTALIVGVAFRFGLLAVTVAQATFMVLFHYPLFAGGSWNAATTAIPIAAVAALALWSFVTALGDQRAFAGLFDE